MTDGSRGRTYGSSRPAGRVPAGAASPPNRSATPPQRGSARPLPPGTRLPKDPKPPRPAKIAGPGKPGKPGKKRSPIWAKALIVLGALVLVTAIGGFATLGYATDKVNSALVQTDLLGNDAAKGNSIKGPINILLAGLDTRPDNTIGSHADSIIIAHIPASHDRVYMVSIPRDTNVYVPPYKPSGWKGGDEKINAAFDFGTFKNQGTEGGFKLLALTITQAYGVSFNGGAVVNFDGFSDLVKKLGGVTLTVDEKTTSIHHGYVTAIGPSAHKAPYVLDPNCGCPKYGFNHPVKGVTPVVYSVGPQHMDAYAALDYVRIRDGLVGTDYARQRHQQQFLKALIKEMYSRGLTSPTKLPGFLDSLGRAISFDRAGISLTDWMFTLKGITPDAVLTIKTNDGQYDSYTGPSNGEARQQLNSTSILMLQDLVADKMDQFVAAYPSWVSNS